MVKSAPSAGDGGRVGKHAHAAGHLGEIATRDVGRGLVADTELESSWAPVDELNGTFGLDDTDSGGDILGYNVTTVEESTSHCKN